VEAVVGRDVLDREGRTLLERHQVGEGEHGPCIREDVLGVPASADEHGDPVADHVLDAVARVDDLARRLQPGDERRVGCPV
jgi:hypothetical protein